MVAQFLNGRVSDNTPYEKIGDEVRSLADKELFDILNLAVGHIKAKGYKVLAVLQVIS